VAGERGSEGFKNDRPLATEAEAKAVASAVRLRILRLCLDSALTNKEIAQRLGSNPATVLHHVRKLVETGFLAAQEERIGARGAREIPYLATRKSWALQLGDEFRSGLAGAMLEVFRTDVAQVPDPAKIHTARLGMRLNDEQYQEVAGRFKALLDEVERMEPGPDARPYSLFMAMHPDASRDLPGVLGAGPQNGRQGPPAGTARGYDIAHSPRRSNSRKRKASTRRVKTGGGDPSDPAPCRSLIYLLSSSAWTLARTSGVSRPRIIRVVRRRSTSSAVSAHSRSRA
jgi:DNA-binding transcriptional ArsR family regulator